MKNRQMLTTSLILLLPVFTFSSIGAQKLPTGSKGDIHSSKTRKTGTKTTPKTTKAAPHKQDLLEHIAQSEEDIGIHIIRVHHRLASLTTEEPIFTPRRHVKPTHSSHSSTSHQTASHQTAIRQSTGHPAKIHTTVESHVAVTKPKELRLAFLPADGVQTNTIDNAEMIHIPAGDFLIGDLEDDDKQSVYYRKKAALAGYWIYKYPVTVKQYSAFCAATGHEMPLEPKWGWVDDNPIVNVTWEDAKMYCDWAKAELPSELEWEKAARGTDGRRYPWGNEWDETRCNNRLDRTPGHNRTIAVNAIAKDVSPYGLHGMAGNVWQWCNDWLEANQRERVLRGGPWTSGNPDDFLSFTRAGDVPTERWPVTGFRCVVHAPPALQ